MSGPEPEPGADAPNAVIVLVVDVGFADLGCCGSEIPTPNIDRLAARGAQFTNVHVTPVCSPTWAALLTRAGVVSAALAAGRGPARR